jgi:hypothetical protein
VRDPQQSEALPAPPVPVLAVAFVLLAQVLCGGWLLSVGVTRRPPMSPSVGLSLAWVVWTTLLPLVLVRPFLLGKDWAWAGAAGMYLAALLFTLGALPAGLPVGALEGLRGGLELALVGLVVSCRRWFGVGPGEGVRTLCRRGWWSLVVGCGLALALLAALAAAPGAGPAVK